MAKKKSTVDELVDDMLSGMPKVYQDLAESIFSASSITEENKIVIDASPALTIGLGGIPEGSFTALTGKEKIGKTVLALTIAAAAQKPEYANKKFCPNGRVVVYCNIEHRLKERDLKGINGLILDDDRFKLIESSPGKFLSSQDYATAIERFVKEVPGCVVIVDSFSMLSSAEEQAAGIGYQDRGKSNGIVSQLMRKIAAPLAINKCIVIGITHGMANTSGWGAAFVEKSANALKYAEDIKLKGKQVKDWKTGSDPKSPQIGQKVDWDVEFAAINPPGAIINSHIRYGHGIDCQSELSEIAVEFGLIEKTGAWYRFSCLEGEPSEKKYNGLEQVIEALNQNPEWYKEIKKQVYEMAGVNL